MTSDPPPSGALLAFVSRYAWTLLPAMLIERCAPPNDLRRFHPAINLLIALGAAVSILPIDIAESNNP